MTNGESRMRKVRPALKKRTLSPCEDDKRGWWEISMLLSESLERLLRKSLAKDARIQENLKKRKGGDPIQRLYRDGETPFVFGTGETRIRAPRLDWYALRTIA